MSRRALLSALALAGVASLALAAPAPAVVSASSASGLALLRVTEAGHQTLPGGTDPLIQDDTTVEPSIAVNPRDKNNVVTGYQMGRDDAGGDVSNGFATSLDGGATWTTGTVPGLTKNDPTSPRSPYTRASDAVVAFGTHDDVYYSSLVFDPNSNVAGTRSAIVNSTSHDRGLHWDAPTIVQDDDGGGLNDKNWVVVDNGTGAGHHPGRVYVLWDRVAGVFAKYSDDGGVTWVPPSPVLAPNVYAAQGIGVIPVVLDSGSLAVAFMADVAPVPTSGSPEDIVEAVTGLSHVVVAVAPGAGAVATGSPLVFNPPSTAATYLGTKVRGQRAGGLVSADVDRATGRFLVTVEDASKRPDGNNDAVLVASDNVESANPTWAKPVRVNGGPLDDQVDHYNPAVATGPGSQVRVMWRQRRESASSDRTTYSTVVSTWAAQSTDGGRTFAPALQVDRGRSDTRFGAFSRGGTFQGDYDQIASLGDVSYVVYCDSFPLSPGEPAPAKPSATTVHHQRTLVSVLQALPAAAAAPVAPVAVAAAPAAPSAAASKPASRPVKRAAVRRAGRSTARAGVSQPTRTLAFTGLGAGVPVLGLGLLAGALALRRRRAARGTGA